MDRLIKCPDCGGEIRVTICEHCGGAGKYECHFPLEVDEFNRQTVRLLKCEKCDGTGLIGTLLVNNEL
jgi:RecJ-like exonuclease